MTETASPIASDRKERKAQQYERPVARVPIIPTSRADSVPPRMASCAVAAICAHALRANKPISV